MQPTATAAPCSNAFARGLTCLTRRLLLGQLLALLRDAIDSSSRAGTSSEPVGVVITSGFTQAACLLVCSLITIARLGLVRIECTSFAKYQYNHPRTSV